jgi:thiol-disulfide isomerase/thioredoxin
MIKNTLLISAILVSGSLAVVETWTNKAGTPAKLDLVRTMDKEGEIAGEFKMQNGKTAVLKLSELDEASGKRLTTANDKRLAKEKPVVLPSAFDALLDNHLISLQDGSLKPCTTATKPTKYYMFYYTASWCPPCHAFTPSLVTFYNELKPNHSADFELVLITSDQDEKAMEGYAKEMKMPWPQLKLANTAKFKSEIKHGIQGIPSVVLTDLEGKVLASSYENGTYKGPRVALDKLKELLGESKTK